MSNWKRTYWVVWVANLITSIGMMSFLPFFPSLLEEMGVEGKESLSRWAGVCFAAAPLTATVSAPIWGALGDRLGRKIMVCRAMLAICIFVGAMAWAATPWHLLGLRCLQGCFSGFIPPSITLVSVAAPADRQGRIAGSLTTSLAIGGLFGPLLGGFAAAALGSHQQVFLLVGALAGLAAMLVWFGAEEDRSKRRAGDGTRGLASVWESTRSDLAQVFRNPVLRSMAALVFAMQFSLGAINPQLDLYVRELLADVDLQKSWLARIGEWGIFDTEGMGLRERTQTLATSLLFGVMAIANLLFLSAWGIVGDRIGHRRALIHCSVLCILSLVIQAAAVVYAMLLLGRLVMGVGMGRNGSIGFWACGRGSERREAWRRVWRGLFSTNVGRRCGRHSRGCDVPKSWSPGGPLGVHASFNGGLAPVHAPQGRSELCESWQVTCPKCGLHRMKRMMPQRIEGERPWSTSGNKCEVGQDLDLDSVLAL